MKKFTTLLTTLLTALMVVTLAGVNVFAETTAITLTDGVGTGTVTKSGDGVTVDVNYTCDFTSYKKGESGKPTTLNDDDIGDKNLTDVKSDVYVKVKATTTNGSIKVNRSYTQTNGSWSLDEDVYDKNSGYAQFEVTNYSYENIKAAVTFAPVATIAQAVTAFDINVASAFDSTFGVSTFSVPTDYNSETSANKEVKFLSGVTSSALSATGKMGTFTVTVTKTGSPQ